MTGLAGKRVVITGSSRGLGRATALAFAGHGARLVVNGTRAEALDETVAGVRALGAGCARWWVRWRNLQPAKPS